MGDAMHPCMFGLMLRASVEGNQRSGTASMVQMIGVQGISRGRSHIGSNRLGLTQSRIGFDHTNRGK